MQKTAYALAAAVSIATLAGCSDTGHETANTLYVEAVTHANKMIEERGDPQRLYEHHSKALQKARSIISDYP